MHKIKFLSFAYLFGASLFFVSCNDDNVTIDEENETGQDTDFEIEFVKTFGGSNIDDAVGVVEANDGAYIILGTTESTDGNVTGKTTDDQDFWLLKLSRTGDIIWEKTYGGSSDDRARNIRKTIDGGYILSGQSRSNDGDVGGNEGFNDFWIVKVDAGGTLQWEKNYGYPGTDAAFDTFQTNDGGYFAIGILDVTASAGQGNNGRNAHAGGDYWAIKMNASGDLIWSRYFGGSFTDTAHSALETTNGDFILVGFSDSDDVDITNNKGGYDFWIVRISSAGDLIWEQNYGGNEIEVPYAITETEDGNFIIAGDTRSADQDVTTLKGNADLWIATISGDGTLMSQKTIGGVEFDSARNITPLASGAFLLTGNTRSSDGDVSVNKGFNDCWGVIVNEEGTVLFEGTYGGSNLDFGNAAIETTDSKLVLVGNTESNDLDITQNKGIKDIMVVKLTNQ